jgi:zinc/manganese transport system substrate-binding protein
MRRFMLTLLFLMASVTASAELEIFACEPEWAALADEIGGDLVTSYSATTALQDPHYIQARPSLIAKVRKADLVICSGK